LKNYLRLPQGRQLLYSPYSVVRYIFTSVPHDPSWQNWPALEYAIMGNIVPDFPLINKSFNLSYSGVDL